MWRPIRAEGGEGLLGEVWGGLGALGGRVWRRKDEIFIFYFLFLINMFYLCDYLTHGEFFFPFFLYIPIYVLAPSSAAFLETLHGVVSCFFVLTEGDRGAGGSLRQMHA